MLGLAILFAVLAIIFGIWGYGAAAATAWAGAQVFFWIFIVLCILSFIGWGSYRWRRPLP